MSASRVKNSEVVRTSDFRRELTFREKKVAEIKREKMKVFADVRAVPKHLITVDLSHARGNLDSVKKAIRELEWKEFPFGRKEQHCDIHWHCINFEQNPDLYGGRVNKFPGMSWICSKNNLFRVLDQMRALYPEEYDFYPRTWYLPEQLHALSHDMHKMHEKHIKPKPTFIIKPDVGSQGEGIYLIRDVSEYTVNGRQHVCQEYLADVFLIDKFKFDLRVYTVLTSADPLEFHICKEGLARFSTVQYETPTNKNIHESYMHLTNYSLNKKSSTFNRSERDDEGSKRTLSSVFSRMRRYGYNVDKVWKRIEQIIVKTLLAIIPDLKIEMQQSLPPNKPGPSCFQILGFDILLMKNLHPMLLEINSSPSLSIDSEVEVSPGIVEYHPSPKDEEVKIPLIRDTLLLVGPQWKIKYLERRRKIRQRRHRKRQERKARKREEERKHQAIEEERRAPVQTERDGVIHIETNHPRSSIIIIRSNEDESPKRPNRESSFAMLDIPKSRSYCMDDMDTNETGLCHSHSLNFNNDDTLNLEYNVRTDFTDCVEAVSGDKVSDLNSSDMAESGISSLNIESVPSSGKTRLVSKNFSDGNNSNNNDRKKNVKNNKQTIKVDDLSRKKTKIVIEDYSSSGPGDRMEESSGSDSETTEPEHYESCLRQLYPDKYADKYEKLRLYEKLADVFMVCLGVRVTQQRLGPTGFRTFARKCRLNKKGLNNATIDILFIDMQRKWEHVNPERTTGLSFRGFLDACHEIAQRKFVNGDVLQTMEDFIEYCQENLKEDQLYQARCNPRLLHRRARPHGYPLLEPMTTPLSVGPGMSPVSLEDQIYLESRLHAEKYHKPTSADDVHYFLQQRSGPLKAIKRSGKRSKSRRKDNKDDER